MIFLPEDFTAAAILPRLNHSLARAEALRGAIAYWTIPPSLLDLNFCQLLSQSSSFCCVDLQWPTDVGHLAHFFALKAHNLYLHCRRLKTNDKQPSAKRLLHTKLLLLDLPGGEAEVWIGSHNFTAAALGGLNLEAGLVIPCPQGSAFYEQVRAYLEYIRARCHRFDPDRLADYRALQDPSKKLPTDDDLHEVLELLTENVAGLAGKTVLLLGDEPSELNKFQAAATTRGRPSLVEAADIHSGQTRLLRARVQSSGYVRDGNATSSGITFSSRPYALRLYGLPAYVNTREKEFGHRELKRFRYWVNIELTELLPAAAYVAPPSPQPQRAKWVPDYAADAELTARELPAEMAQHPFASELFPRREKDETVLIESPDFLIEKHAPYRYNTLEQTNMVSLANLPLEAGLREAGLPEVRQFYEQWFELQFFSAEAQRGTLALQASPAALPPSLQALRRALLRKQQLR